MRSRRHVPLAVALAIAIAAPSGAVAAPRAADPGHRAVAVLAVREGSAALPDVGPRVARLLADRTSLRVVDADAARAIYGEALEADLAACAGDAACVGGLGRRLGVTEVLLVGVSQFGDVILTLQRIDATSGQVAGRIAEALAEGARPDDAALLGYLRRVLPADDFRRWGVLRVVANLAGAKVAVGGAVRGETPLAPLRLPAPARYDILVQKPGYLDFRATVAVPPDAEVLVRPELDRRPAEPAWYQRGWVLGAVGVVALGAVATAVVLSRGGDDDVPVRVEPF